MKTKLTSIFCWAAVVAALIVETGCKKESAPSPEFAKAYTRLVFVDAPAQGRVQFLLDGKINVNGDSLLHSPDGSPYIPDGSLNTTTTINYNSGGWTDNSPVNFPGAYGFSYKPGNQYAVFPNPTNRIDLGPVIGGYNYYNWAAIPAGQHQLSMYSVINSTAFGNPVSVKGDKFIDQSVTLEGGAVQTFFVLNKAVAKQYVSIENGNVSTPLSVYQMGETVNFFSNQMDLLTVTDHPDRLPKFKDSSAYIRFVNVTPAYPDQSLNQNTDSLDIYIAPIYGERPDIVDLQYGYIYPIADSIGDERQVVRGLARNRSTTDAPFYELDVASVMRMADTVYAPPAVGQAPVPRYYRVLAYRTGKSKATGDFPVAKGDWLALFNLFPGYDYNGVGLTGGNWVDSWLVRSNGKNFHPAICTILLSVDENVFQGPDAVGDTHYLGFRSCINYQKAGVNDVFFQ